MNEPQRTNKTEPENKLPSQNLADASRNLKCVKTAGGKYGLYMRGNDGKMSRVRKIGLSARPFEVVDTYENRPVVAVKRHVKTKDGVQQRLYIINTTTGKIPPMFANGVTSILYDIFNRKFVFDNAIGGGTSGDCISSCDTPSVPYEHAHHTYATMPGLALEIIVLPRRKRIKPRVVGRNRKFGNRIKRKTPLTAPQKTELNATFTAPYNIKRKPRIQYKSNRVTRATSAHTAADNATTLQKTVAASVANAARQHQK